MGGGGETQWREEEEGGWVTGRGASRQDRQAADRLLL